MGFGRRLLMTRAAEGESGGGFIGGMLRRRHKAVDQPDNPGGSSTRPGSPTGSPGRHSSSADFRGWV